MRQVRSFFRLTFILCCLGHSIQGQNIAGTWAGSLEVMNSKLRLVFHIEKDSTGYSAKMDSPDQGALGLPVGSTSFDGSSLKLELPNIGATYIATFKPDSIFEGTFSQMGQRFPLRLVKSAEKTTTVRRPQEPKPPFPYRVEEVTYVNKNAGISLSGTLTIPETEGPFPAAILISGSGPQNRDEEIFGHKPFWVIADFLTRRGMAVLRYDDRGVGASEGDFSSATTADFSTDAAAGFDFLQTRPEINKEKIGLIGHSEGGMIAPMVAAKNKKISFLVLLAAPGIKIDSLLILQNEAILRSNGASDPQIAQVSEINRKSYQFIKEEKQDWEKELSTLLFSVFDDAGGMTKTQKEAAVAQQTKFLTSPWMRYFLKFDPTLYLGQVTCDVLGLNGSKDLQVTPKENLEGLKNSLLKAKGASLKELEGLNHLFQESKTGLVAEYGSLEQTFAPSALQEISDWLNQKGLLSNP